MGTASWSSTAARTGDGELREDTGTRLQALAVESESIQGLKKRNVYKGKGGRASPQSPGAGFVLSVRHLPVRPRWRGVLGGTGNGSSPAAQGTAELQHSAVPA